MLALPRGETVSAAWLVLAAIGTYLVAYRFYSRFICHPIFNSTTGGPRPPSG